MMSDTSSNFTREIGAMFSRIAPRYDLLNRLMTGGLDQKWRRETVRELDTKQSALRFLDLATGTAELALNIFAHYPDKKIRVDAVDLSPEMLLLAEKKAKQRGLGQSLHFHCASIEHLPFPDNTFDGATMGFGIRNVEDREKGLREICRVLKPGAKLAILEALPPDNFFNRTLQHFHMKLSVRLLGFLFSEAKAYQYLGSSVSQFPRAVEFIQTMQQTGFRECTHRTLHFSAVTLFSAKK